jgi:hypothetical protein
LHEALPIGFLGNKLIRAERFSTRSIDIPNAAVLECRSPTGSSSRCDLVERVASLAATIARSAGNEASEADGPIAKRRLAVQR